MRGSTVADSLGGQMIPTVSGESQCGRELGQLTQSYTSCDVLTSTQQTTFMHTTTRMETAGMLLPTILPDQWSVASCSQLHSTMSSILLLTWPSFLLDRHYNYPISETWTMQTTNQKHPSHPPLITPSSSSSIPATCLPTHRNATHHPSSLTPLNVMPELIHS